VGACGWNGVEESRALPRAVLVNQRVLRLPPPPIFAGLRSVSDSRVGMTQTLSQSARWCEVFNPGDSRARDLNSGRTGRDVRGNVEFGKIPLVNPHFLCGASAPFFPKIYAIRNFQKLARQATNTASPRRRGHRSRNSTRGGRGNPLSLEVFSTAKGADFTSTAPRLNAERSSPNRRTFRARSS